MYYKILKKCTFHFENWYISFCGLYISDELANLVDKFLIKENDLLFTMTGTKGKRDYFFTLVVPKINCNLYLNQRVGLLRVENKYININYINIVLKHSSVLDEIFKTETGNVNQGNIGSENTLKLKIPLPPLSEQYRIVSKIEEIFALIDTIEQNQSDLKSAIEQTKAKVLDMAIHGKHLSMIDNKKTSDNEHYTENLPKGWILTKMENICQLLDGEKKNNLELPYLEVKFLRGKSEENLKTSGKFIPKNTYLILVDGENSGEIFKTEIDGYQGSTLKILNISEKVNQDFIFYILKKEQQTFKESKTGSAIPHLNKKLFKELPVWLPPLEEQKEIVQKIEKIFAELDFIEQNF